MSEVPLSDCEVVAQHIGLPIDDAPNCPTVPNVCCNDCHQRSSRPVIHLNGQDLYVCCEMMRAYNDAK
jgi:hypothetical protein